MFPLINTTNFMKLENQRSQNEIISREDYNQLQAEMVAINIAILNCGDRNKEAEIPQVIERLKSYLGGTEWRCLELVKRPLEVLHLLLLSRLYINKQFPNPLNVHDLVGMRIFATSEIEIRNLYSIYIDAIESSLIPEEA